MIRSRFTCWLFAEVLDWVSFFPPPFPGDYEVSVKFNDQHIPDSPYLVPVVAPVNDARRLSVAGLQVRHEETPPHPACPAWLKGGDEAQLHKNVTSLPKQGLEWFGLLIIDFKLDSKRHLKQPELVDPQQLHRYSG